MTLDIGGEGRHPHAWNLNPSPVRTLGPRRGEPIPRLIRGRAEQIPLADQSVLHVIVERTPLRREALLEIARVVAPYGSITLRHAPLPNFDPHRLAISLLPGQCTQRSLRRGRRILLETQFDLGQPD